MNASSYFTTYYPAAKRASDATGVPTLLILAQSALESGWGKTIPGNMFFGIKADKGWTGKVQTLWTHEYINGKNTKVQAKFRAYSSAEESFKDWANFLKSNKRYSKVLAAKDTVTAAKAIAAAGYATDPNYANLLIKIAHSLSPSAIPAAEYAKALAGATVGSTGGKLGLLAVFLLGGIGVYLSSKGGNLSA